MIMYARRVIWGPMALCKEAGCGTAKSVIQLFMSADKLVAHLLLEEESWSLPTPVRTEVSGQKPVSSIEPVMYLLTAKSNRTFGARYTVIYLQSLRRRLTATTTKRTKLRVLCVYCSALLLFLSSDWFPAGQLSVTPSFPCPSSSVSPRIATKEAAPASRAR